MIFTSLFCGKTIRLALLVCGIACSCVANGQAAVDDFDFHFEEHDGFHALIYKGPKVGGPDATIQREEAGMDAVYSQASFGGNPIDIRFNPNASVVGPLSIQTNTDLTNLFALSSIDPTISMFFVDALDWCGSFNVNIVGCATTPGHQMVLESGFSSAVQTQINAHELGHNLGLFHEASPNLMEATIMGNTNLTGAQVATILTSPRVQGVAPGQFVSITAIRVVPEPTTFGLAILIGLACVQAGRRNGFRAC